MLDTKTVGATTAAVMMIGVAMANHSPDGFWPVTFSGWIALATGVSGLIVSGYLLYKKSLSPVVGSVDALKKHFDGKIEELEDKYDAEFGHQRVEHKESMDSFTRAVHDRLNGFGGRLDGFHERIKQNETDFEIINRQMGESQEDRRHLNQQLADIRAGNQRIIELLLQRRVQ